MGFALGENEDLVAQTRALQEKLSNVRNEANSGEAELNSLRQAGNPRQNELNESLVAAKLDAVFLRAQLARTERKLHFHECASVATTSDNHYRWVSTNGGV